ncbi:MAG: hypothetical protein WD577_11275 [Bacteroidales bacterium]
MKNSKIVLSALMLFLVHVSYAQIPGVNLDFKNASVATHNNEIIVSTGEVTGKWQWTGVGFVTTGFKNIADDKEWVTKKPRYLADWDLAPFKNAEAQLINLDAEISDDNNFTSQHIRVTAEIEYPESELGLRFEIWAYPGAPGLRTQVFLKGIGRYFAPGNACSNNYRIDYLPVSSENLVRQAVGYLNDHDGRNDDHLDFVVDDLNEHEFFGNEEEYKAANILFVYNNEGGVGLVKESHKVANLEGINTGMFEYSSKGIETTGWGASLAYVDREYYIPCWANWRISWAGGEDEKQLAIKMFDRMRYPVSEEDIVLVTNIWGAGQGVKGAREENILREIESCADLGIDVVQIDAGWQDRDDREKTFKYSSSVYPDGWENIMKLAKQENIKMGIWNTASGVNKVPNKLIHLNDAGFLYYKVDIGTWSTYDMLSDLTQNARDLLIHSNHQARINWDVTHKGLRVGYLFNREYGNLFLQNRRLQMDGRKKSPSHAYVPRRVLKDQWLFAPYLNLNQMMFNVQTTEHVLNEYSNASLYGDVYSFAITMMSSPLFFTETWRYSPESREAMKEIISIYKTHRNELYQGYVFALGERANDNSWTGFQNYHPGKDFGYLTLFREIDNQDKNKRIQLHFIKGKTLAIEDLMTGEKKNIKADDEGFVEFLMEDPASFKFYKYQIEND